MLKYGNTEERQALEKRLKLDDKAMKGDIASEIAIENLLTIVNEEDDKEKDREQERLKTLVKYLF